MPSPQSSQPSFTLHYWPSIPGRGEFVRLAFESVGHAYTENNDVATLQKLTMNAQHVANPTHFAVPALEVHNVLSSLLDDGSKDEGENDEGEQTGTAKAQKTQHSQDVKSSTRSSRGATSSVFISQTAAILNYLAPILHLDGVASLRSSDDPTAAALRRAHVLQLTLTALDLNSEVHDTHHPVATGDYYENQKAEAARRAQDFRANRLPKFLRHFNNALHSNTTNSGWLVGEHLTIADLTVFQVIDGLQFAFPARMAALQKQGKADDVFALYSRVSKEPKVAAYLQSERRKEYSNGVFRYYKELDEAE